MSMPARRRRESSVGRLFKPSRTGWKPVLPSFFSAGSILCFVLAGTAAIGAAQPAGPAPAPAERQGTLHIAGQAIEKLVLVDRQGREQVLSRPGPSVSLPAGEYQVREVRLQGGFQRRFRVLRGLPTLPGQITIAPGRTSEITIGGPLTSTVTVTRRGSVLKLDYALLGADQCPYSPENHSDPPRFTVYQGDREIGSGSFKYG